MSTDDLQTGALILLMVYVSSTSLFVEYIRKNDAAELRGDEVSTSVVLWGCASSVVRLAAFIGFMFVFTKLLARPS